jgi:hypothetical protein
MATIAAKIWNLDSKNSRSRPGTHPDRSYRPARSLIDRQHEAEMAFETRCAVAKAREAGIRCHGVVQDSC